MPNLSAVLDLTMPFPSVDGPVVCDPNVVRRASVNCGDKQQTYPSTVKLHKIGIE